MAVKCVELRVRVPEALPDYAHGASGSGAVNPGAAALVEAVLGKSLRHPHIVRHLSTALMPLSIRPQWCAPVAVWLRCCLAHTWRHLQGPARSTIQHAHARHPICRCAPTHMGCGKAAGTWAPRSRRSGLFRWEPAVLIQQCSSAAACSHKQQQPGQRSGAAW